MRRLIPLLSLFQMYQFELRLRILAHAFVWDVSTNRTAVHLITNVIINFPWKLQVEYLTKNHLIYILVRKRKKIFSWNITHHILPDIYFEWDKLTNSCIYLQKNQKVVCPGFTAHHTYRQISVEDIQISIIPLTAAAITSKIWFKWWSVVSHALSLRLLIEVLRVLSLVY